jgi:hypothetical protein
MVYRYLTFGLFQSTQRKRHFRDLLAVFTGEMNMRNGNQQRVTALTASSIQRFVKNLSQISAQIEAVAAAVSEQTLKTEQKQDIATAAAGVNDAISKLRLALGGGPRLIAIPGSNFEVKELEALQELMDGMLGSASIARRLVSVVIQQRRRQA